VRFLDTNVLLYSVSGDSREAKKAALATGILQSSDLALSVQVLQEFYVQATRATRPHRLPHEKAMAFIESWLRFPVQELTVDILRAAVKSSASAIRFPTGKPPSSKPLAPSAAKRCSPRI
jgi:predicted nucleic acid-binding protein